MIADKHGRLWKRDWFWALFLFLLTFLSRGFLAERGMAGFSYDSGNFALAARNYSLPQNRPHLPGYFLYVQSIRLLNKIFRDSEKSMVFLSMLYSSLAAAALFALLRKWFGWRSSGLLTLVVITNPMVWFYGLVSEIYAFDLFFGVAVCFIGLSLTGIYWLPAFMALGGGVRPSSAVLLFPLYLFLWWKAKNSQNFSWTKFGLAHFLGVGLFLAWFLPMIGSAGGLSAYLRLYHTQNPVDPIGFRQNIFRLTSFFLYAGIPLFAAGVEAVLRRGSRRIVLQIKHNLKLPPNPLMLFWFLPALLFFIFVHYSKGYFLISLAALFVFVLQGWSSDRNGTRWFVAVILFQCGLFLLLPYSRPNPQIYLAPGQRTINLAQLWWARTMSVQEMSRRRLKTLEEDSRSVRAALQRIGDEAKRNGGAVHPVFVDPTSPLSVRALQAGNPRRDWASMSLTEPNIYGWYHGLNQFRRQGLADLLKHAVILSRKDFVRKYLTDFDLRFYSDDDLIFFTCNPDQAERLAERYRELFIRTGAR